jgi:hypothetical protein
MARIARIKATRSTVWLIVFRFEFSHPCNPRSTLVPNQKRNCGRNGKDVGGRSNTGVDGLPAGEDFGADAGDDADCRGNDQAGDNGVFKNLAATVVTESPANEAKRGPPTSVGSEAREPVELAHQ